MNPCFRSKSRNWAPRVYDGFASTSQGLHRLLDTGVRGNGIDDRRRACWDDLSSINQLPRSILARKPARAGSDSRARWTLRVCQKRVGRAKICTLRPLTLDMHRLDLVAERAPDLLLDPAPGDRIGVGLRLGLASTRVIRSPRTGARRARGRLPEHAAQKARHAALGGPRTGGLGRQIFGRCGTCCPARTLIGRMRTWALSTGPGSSSSGSIVRGIGAGEPDAGISCARERPTG